MKRVPAVLRWVRLTVVCTGQHDHVRLRFRLRFERRRLYPQKIEVNGVTRRREFCERELQACHTMQVALIQGYAGVRLPF